MHLCRRLLMTLPLLGLSGCQPQPYLGSDFLVGRGLSEESLAVASAGPDDGVAVQWRLFADHARVSEAGWRYAIAETSPDGRAVIVQYRWPAPKVSDERVHARCWPDWRSPEVSWPLPSDLESARFVSDGIVVARLRRGAGGGVLLERESGRELASGDFTWLHGSGLGDSVLVYDDGVVALGSASGPWRAFDFASASPGGSRKPPGFALNSPIVVHDRFAVMSTGRGMLYVFSLADGQRLDVQPGWWLQAASPSGWGLAMQASGEPYAFRVSEEGRLVMGGRVPDARGFAFNRASPSGRFLHLFVFGKYWGSDQVVIAEPGDTSVVPPLPDYVDRHEWIAHDTPRAQPDR